MALVQFEGALNKQQLSTCIRVNFINMNKTAEQTFFEESTRFVVDSQYFSPHDYALFVESIETIARIERQRKARLEKRKERKRANNTTARLHDEDTPTPSDDEAEDETIVHLESKKIMLQKTHEDDENYFSASSTNSPRLSQTQLNANGMEAQLISDSEDSGIFPVSSATFVNLPRYTVLPNSSSGSSTLRSRLIKLVRKHSQAQKQRKEDCERMLNAKSTKFYKFKTLSLRKKSRVQTDAEKAQTADMHFINKALTYLTF